MIFEDLSARGISSEALARVHAPLGFAIGSQTVPEIAISIVAELIAVRNLGSVHPGSTRPSETERIGFASRTGLFSRECKPQRRMSNPRIFALLPAGGTSSRMGSPKLALPLGGLTVLQRVLGTLTSAHVSNILVVLGPQVAFLKPLAEQAGAWDLVLWTKQTPDMRATMQRGLAG